MPVLRPSAHCLPCGRQYATGRSCRVNYDIEALGRARRDEVPYEQIVVRFTCLERVLATRISLLKSPLADRIRNIEKMKLMGHPGFIDDGVHPASKFNGVCREIENNREALPQNIDNV